MANAEPTIEPIECKTDPIYHITTVEVFKSVKNRKGLVPLNWILEGTHEQIQDDSVAGIGLDAARGAGGYESPQAHEEEVARAKLAWEQSDPYIKEHLGKRYADIKLGRKRDFVYGTRRRDTVAGYRDDYLGNGKNEEDLVIIRWIRGTEPYYPDQESPSSIKSPSSINISRMQVASAVGLGDASSEEMEALSW
eukprot:CAMPEP_0197452742 /NCGR_PEP_ID=MMETSP1175-20131217/32860_1 /TAXON_ID=1003142 /ORGANISM="Triceratium dubium, Strain CCMP147" /LENGTH=193 /DNA_ID=CAMNT_0042985815 /DNA_START=61 /DNA_END=639 /DNA_ORIENTATION=+